MEENFYLTLLSNSSFNYFPENRTSNFKVHLTKEINLEGEWKVALSEISYPHTIYNVTDKNNKVIVKRSYNGGELGTQTDNYIVSIPEGFYSNLEDVVKVINEGFFKLFKMNLFADKLTPTNHCEVVVNREALEQCLQSLLISEGHDESELVELNDFFDSELQITLENRLAIQLGFSPTDNLIDALISPQVANINFGLPQEIFVYIDIIEPQIISDYCSQVIKIVKTFDQTTEFSDVVSREIFNRNYMQLCKRRFQTLSIELRDSTGELIPFRFGTSIVTVHFKKEQQKEKHYRRQATKTL